jgi:hypothetical protein
VQRSVVGDLDIALGDLFFELCYMSKGLSGVKRKDLRLRFGWQVRNRLTNGVDEETSGLCLRWSDDLWGCNKGLMCATRGEVVRLYLKIGDMVVTMSLNYEMRDRLMAERIILAELSR